MMIRGELAGRGGQVFLRIGAETFASTRFGSLYPWGLPEWSIYHIASDTCYSRWFPGGVSATTSANDLTSPPLDDDLSRLEGLALPRSRMKDASGPRLRANVAQRCVNQ